MKIYNYHRVTKEFTSVSDARPDPAFPGKWLLPACSTAVAPPSVGAHEVAIFNGVAWEVQQDYRGVPAWSVVDASPVIISAIGPLDDDIVILDPSAHNHPVWSGNGWVNDDEAELAAVRKKKILEIKKAYLAAEDEATITVNGATYRADRVFLAEVDLERRLAEANGESNIIVFDVDLDPHTASLTAVDNVMQQIRLQTKANYQKGKNLVRQANHAQTLAQIAAVVWSS